MRHQDHARTAVAQVPNGWQGLADARVVRDGDGPIFFLGGNVEIDPDEYLAMTNINVFDGKLGHEEWERKG